MWGLLRNKWISICEDFGRIEFYIMLYRIDFLLIYFRGILRFLFISSYIIFWIVCHIKREKNSKWITWLSLFSFLSFWNIIDVLRLEKNKVNVLYIFREPKRDMDKDMNQYFVNIIRNILAWSIWFLNILLLLFYRIKKGIAKSYLVIRRYF